MRSYKPGKVIESIDELLKQEFIYNRHKVLNKGWFSSWTIRFAQSELIKKHIFYAIKIETENKNVK